MIIMCSPFLPVDDEKDTAMPAPGRGQKGGLVQTPNQKLAAQVSNAALAGASPATSNVGKKRIPLWKLLGKFSMIYWPLVLRTTYLAVLR